MKKLLVFLAVVVIAALISGCGGSSHHGKPVNVEASYTYYGSQEEGGEGSVWEYTGEDTKPGQMRSLKPGWLNNYYDFERDFIVSNEGIRLSPDVIKNRKIEFVELTYTGYTPHIKDFSFKSSGNSFKPLARTVTTGNGKRIRAKLSNFTVLLYDPSLPVAYYWITK